MTAWQVEFHVLPRRAVTTAAALSAAMLADTNWWAGYSFPADYTGRLAAVLLPARTSSAGVEMWGREDGNRVDVSFDAGRVSRVMVRVDVRRLDSKFGALLIDLVRKANAVLVRGDGVLVEPSISAYAGALRNSAAWRFASDPAAFLASHSARDEEESEDE